MFYLSYAVVEHLISLNDFIISFLFLLFYFSFWIAFMLILLNIVIFLKLFFFYDGSFSFIIILLKIISKTYYHLLFLIFLKPASIICNNYCSVMLWRIFFCKKISLIYSKQIFETTKKAYLLDISYNFIKLPKFNELGIRTCP